MPKHPSLYSVLFLPLYEVYTGLAFPGRDAVGHPSFDPPALFSYEPISFFLLHVSEVTHILPPFPSLLVALSFACELPSLF